MYIKNSSFKWVVCLKIGIYSRNYYKKYIFVENLNITASFLWSVLYVS